GLRDRVLLAGHPAHEAAAAGLAARFHPAQDRDQLEPGGRHRFARHQVAEHDAVAAQKLPGPGLQALFLLELGDAARKQRPAAALAVLRAGALAAPARAAGPLMFLLREASDGGEAVGADEAE